MSFADDLRAHIEREYRTSGNNLGWRFLSSGPGTLETARVVLLGMNPGGRDIPADHGEFAMQDGQSAYRDESWKGRPPGQEALQVQVLALCDWLGVAPHDVLSGNLVPFRSPNWAALKNRSAALRFGEDLWRHVLGQVRPRLVIAFGKPTADALIRLLDVAELSPVAIGWGRQTARKGRTAWGHFVHLPHLSRFGIMGRPQSRAALVTLFGEPA